MILMLILGSVSSFLVTFLVTPFLIRTCRQRGITGVDVHKLSRPVCAEMGGLAVLLGFSVGFSIILLLSNLDSSLSLIYAFLTIVFASLVGVVDDLFGLRQRYKPFLVAFASIPLLVWGMNLNQQQLGFPLVGSVFVGAFYLFLIPLSVGTASNMTNMLAGFNGLESGIGAISCFGLGVACALSGRSEACLIAFPLSAAFSAFLKYNWFPAKIFPGDTGTLMSGAAIATVAIFGGVEFAGICIIAPAAADFTLKVIARRPFSHRRLLGDTNVGDSGVLTSPPYAALPHAFMKIAHLKESELVSWLLFVQAIYSTVGILAAFMLK